MLRVGKMLVHVYPRACPCLSLCGYVKKIGLHMMHWDARMGYMRKKESCFIILHAYQFQTVCRQIINKNWNLTMAKYIHYFMWDRAFVCFCVCVEVDSDFIFLIA